MFCWWQDCPPTMEGPCKERGPFSPCLNGAKLTTGTKQTTNKATTSTTKAASTKELTTSSSKNTETSSGTSIPGSTTTTLAEATTKSTPKICIVMGREYKIGDKLPHDTGNCVECVCGPAGQVTCSPNQCAPVVDDINDYRPPGPRQPLADMF